MQAGCRVSCGCCEPRIFESRPVVEWWRRETSRRCPVKRRRQFACVWRHACTVLRNVFWPRLRGSFLVSSSSNAKLDENKTEKTCTRERHRVDRTKRGTEVEHNVPPEGRGETRKKAQPSQQEVPRRSRGGKMLPVKIPSPEQIWNAPQSGLQGVRQTPMVKIPPSPRWLGRQAGQSG